MFEFLMMMWITVVAGAGVVVLIGSALERDRETKKGR